MTSEKPGSNCYRAFLLVGERGWLVQRGWLFKQIDCRLSWHLLFVRNSVVTLIG